MLTEVLALPAGRAHCRGCQTAAAAAAAADLRLTVADCVVSK